MSRWRNDSLAKRPKFNKVAKGQKYFKYSIVINLFRLSAYRLTMPGINVLDKRDFVLDHNDKALSLRSVSATCVL